MTTPTLSIAIPQAGDESEDALTFLKKCGIDLEHKRGELSSQADNFPIRVLFLLPNDIPQYVAEGVADLGIIGEDVVFEKAREVDLLHRLGFGKCHLAIAMAHENKFNNIADLNGLRIATSYPKILHRYFQKFNIKAEVHEIDGSVEIASGMGLADAICYRVTTEDDFANGLKEVDVVLRSECVLIAGKGLAEWKREILRNLLSRVVAVQKAKNRKLISLNVPRNNLEKMEILLTGNIISVTPPSTKGSWSQIQVELHENDFWKIVADLKALGAKDILMIPIEKIID